MTGRTALRSCSRPAKAPACARRGRRCCMRSPAGRCWRMCWRPSRGRQHACRGGGRARIRTRSRPRRGACCRSADVFVQHERRGTAHAVLAARARSSAGADDILVIFGDTPLIRAADAGNAARRAGRRRGGRGARLSRRPTRPAMAGWSSDGGELVAHPRGARRERQPSAPSRFATAG